MANDKPDFAANEARSNSRRGLRAIVGLVLALAGSVVLFGMAMLGTVHSARLNDILFSLGLGMTSLISAIAQIVVFTGLAMMWSALKRQRRD